MLKKLKSLFISNSNPIYPEATYETTKSAINKAYTITQIAKEEYNNHTLINSIFEGHSPLRPGNQIILQQSNDRKLGFTPKAFMINILGGLFKGEDGYMSTRNNLFTYQWRIINCGYENDPIMVGDPIKGNKCETGNQTFILDFPPIEISSWQRLQLVITLDASANSSVDGILAVVFHSGPNIGNELEIANDALKSIREFLPKCWTARS